MQSVVRNIVDTYDSNHGIGFAFRANHINPSECGVIISTPKVTCHIFQAIGDNCHSDVLKK